MHMQNLVKIHQFVLNLRKLTCDYPNLYLVNTKAYAKFGQIPSIRFQHFEQEQNSDINQGLAKIDAYIQQSQPRSCHYQCACKIWSKAINSFSRC